MSSDKPTSDPATRPGDQKPNNSAFSPKEMVALQTKFLIIFSAIGGFLILCCVIQMLVINWTRDKAPVGSEAESVEVVELARPAIDRPAPTLSTRSI